MTKKTAILTGFPGWFSAKSMQLELPLMIEAGGETVVNPTPYDDGVILS